MDAEKSRELYETQSSNGVASCLTQDWKINALDLRTNMAVNRFALISQLQYANEALVGTVLGIHHSMDKLW